MNVDFRLVGRADRHDADNMICTTSHLRGSAGTWINPYIQNLMQPSWTPRSQFVEEVQKQFGIIDKKGKARNMLKSMLQGKTNADGILE